MSLDIYHLHINEQNWHTWNRKISLQFPKVKLEIPINDFVFMGSKFYNLLLIDIRKCTVDYENKVSSFFH